MGKDITGKIKEYEYFSNMVIPKNIPFVVRLDGSNFRKFTEIYQKPFDESFHNLMESITKELMKKYPEIYEATTHSDEISLYLPGKTELFNRRVEKIVSELSSLASSYIGKATGRLGYFDGRIILAPGNLIDEYRRDRWLDAFRNCVNSVTYWGLRQDKGMSARRATKELHGKTGKEKQEVAFQELNVNIAKLPNWQKEGSRFVYDTYIKSGFNPLKNRTVDVTRRKRIRSSFPYTESTL